MAGVYSASGAFRMTVVDGTTFVGAYAPDGSLNVIEAPGNVPVGWRHPCGAMYITITTGTGRTTYWAPDGSLYVTFGSEVSNAVYGERADVVVGEDPVDVQLDPEFTSINLELTSDKKGGKKTASSATWSSARGSVAATGKVYFEAQATVLSGLQEAAFGLYNATFTLEGDQPGAANSVAYQSVGQTGDEGTFTAATAFAQGERVMFAYDSGTGKFWVGRLGTWSGDPAAGTGEAGTITGTVYPGISLKTTGGEIFLYLSANDWLYSAPTGWGSLANPGEAGSSAFDVTTMTSLNRWYDPSDAASRTIDGSNNYTALADKSGNGYGLSGSVPATGVIGGLTCLKSSGTTTLQGTTGITPFSGIAKPFTFIAVAKIDTVTTNGTLASFNSASSALPYIAIGNSASPFPWRVQHRDDAVVSTESVATTNADTANHVIEYVFDGSTLTIVVDGVTVLNADPHAPAGTLTLDRFSLFSVRNGANTNFGIPAQMGEMILCAAALDATERGNARTYLADKWGITL